MNIKEIVKNNTVKFLRYRQGNMYYVIHVDNTNYSSLVPLEDIGDATLLANDKAIMFMRYIRKPLDQGTFINEDK